MMNCCLASHVLLFLLSIYTVPHDGNITYISSFYYIGELLSSFSGDLLSSIFYPSVIKDLQIQFNSETVTIFLMLPENQKVLYHKCASVECTLPPDNCPLYFNVSTKE